MIYFIQDSASGAIKIGYTAGSAGCRMRELQTGNPSALTLLRVIDGTPRDERNLHVRFAKQRTVGEWFKADPHLLAFIEGVEDLGGGNGSAPFAAIPEACQA